MKVSELLEIRRKQWRELEGLCDQIENRGRAHITSQSISRFASLYRAACADLALADENRLPQNTINYLHQLVGRAHNQLYRSRRFDFDTWKQTMLVDVPRQIFNDRCVQCAFMLFWGAFILSAILAASATMWPDFATQVISESQLEQFEQNFSEPLGNRPGSVNAAMAFFYIYHNTGIGLMCFASGILVIPGVVITLFNAVSLGTVFGYMARPDVAQSEVFYEFVTAHGPYELTAIVLSAGAGLRLGMSWLKTNGLTRYASLRKAAGEAMPLMSAAVILFFLAALIEGFVSPSVAPYWFKATIAVVSSGTLMFYFIILGYPREA